MKLTVTLGCVCLTLLIGCRQHAAEPTLEPAAQPAPATPLVGPQTFGDGWQRARPARVFIGADLCNHINGGAERFLEYGFDRATVEQYTRGDDEIRLELYAMENPTAARAVYLYFRGPGKPLEGINGRHVGNRYQVIMQTGRYFVQITNYTGRPQCVPGMVALANHLWPRLPADAEIPLLERLPKANRVPRSTAIIRGPYSLQTLYTLGPDDVLQLNRTVFGVAADYRSSGDETYTLLMVPYDHAQQARDAFGYLVNHLDPYLHVLHQADDLLCFRGADEMYGSAVLEGALLTLRLRMSEMPIECAAQN